MILFMDRSSFSVRSEWRRVEPSEMQLEKDKRVLEDEHQFGGKLRSYNDYWVSIGGTTITGGRGAIDSVRRNNYAD